MPLYLTESDLRFLVETVANQRRDLDEVVTLIRDKEVFIEQMLDDPKLLERVFNDEDALITLSPRFLFTILLRHVRREIEKENYLYDYEVGARKQRIPVFAVDEVSGLLGESDAVDYLAEMLASFARTRSVVHSYTDECGRSQKDRFDDTDIDDMIELCQRLQPAERARYYRRIGDIALFLSGIFPDHAAYYHFLTPRSARRVSRGRNLHDYEREGQAFYRRAARHPAASHRGSVLNTLSKRALSAPRRGQHLFWFARIGLRIPLVRAWPHPFRSSAILPPRELS